MSKLKNTTQLDRFVDKVKDDLVNAAITTSFPCEKAQAHNIFKLTAPILQGCLHRVNVMDLHDSVGDLLYDSGALSLIVKLNQITAHYSHHDEKSSCHNIREALGLEPVRKLTSEEVRERVDFSVKYSEFISEKIKHGELCFQISSDLPSQSKLGLLHHGILDFQLRKGDIAGGLMDMWTLNKLKNKGDHPVNCIIETSTTGYQLTIDGRANFNVRGLSKDAAKAKLAAHKESLLKAERAGRHSSSDFSDVLSSVGMFDNDFTHHIAGVSNLITDTHKAQFGS